MNPHKFGKLKPVKTKTILLSSFGEDDMTNYARAAGTDELNVKKLQNSFLKKGIIESCPKPLVIKGPNGKDIIGDGVSRITAAKNIGYPTLEVDYYEPEDPHTFDYDLFLTTMGLHCNDHLPSKSVTTNDLKRSVASHVKNNPDNFKTEEDIQKFIQDMDITSIAPETQQNIAKSIFISVVNTAQIQQFPRGKGLEKFRNILRDVEVETVENIFNKQSYQSTTDPVIRSIEYFQLTGVKRKIAVVTKNCENANQVFETRSRAVKTWERTYQSIRDGIYDIDKKDNGYLIDYPFEIVGAIPQLRGQEENDNFVEIL
jgi:hypothetical protein